jgi:SAM-dependent methyltransferase
MIRDLMRTLGLPVLVRPLRRTVGKIFARRLRYYDEVYASFQEKVGLELGGPSSVFQPGGLLPIYPLAARIDNCNFSSETIWAGRIAAGDTFRYDERRTPGRQFVAEATRLDFAPSASYDFVLSSHMLEHSANPVKVLAEWRRVVKPGGTLVVILPHRDATFDHRRPVTTIQHLLEDFERGTGEDDLTHLPEILELHDLKRDPEAGSLESFKLRSQRNFENRCLHQHVFDTRLAIELVNVMQLRIRAVEAVNPLHIAIVADRPGDNVPADNEQFLRQDATYRRSSPFPSDRAARTSPR